MARVHALVATFRLDFQAALTTAAFHELIDRVVAFADRMADFLALVAALKESLANLAAVWDAFVAEHVSHEFLATVAHPSHWLQARWAIASVALHRARMAALELLLAGAFARWLRHTALDRRVELCDAAWAEERVDRHDFARFAEADMAEVGALVEPTRELLIALDHAEMSTFGVGAASHRAANFLAVVLLTLLQLIADAFALQVVDRVDLFTRHHLLAQLIRIVHLVARILGLALIAGAAFVDELFTPHALLVMALLDALVSATGQESLAQ